MPIVKVAITNTLFLYFFLFCFVKKIPFPNKFVPSVLLSVTDCSLVDHRGTQTVNKNNNSNTSTSPKVNRRENNVSFPDNPN